GPGGDNVQFSSDSQIAGVDYTNFGTGDIIGVIGGGSVSNIHYTKSSDTLTFTQNGTTVTASVTLESGITNPQFHAYYDATLNEYGVVLGTAYQTCFLDGTMLRTETGEKPVEEIHIGDKLVARVDGQDVLRPVVWVGKKHMRVDRSRAPDLAGYPVRIIRGAIARGVPNKDLLVTPEHCLFFDGKFIPSRMLVNGRSIFYDRTIVDYDFYHVETERHSVICADGMLTETYLDTGNRRGFYQYGTIVRFGGAQKTWENDAAVPLATDRETVEPLYRRIEARAAEAGIASTAPRIRLTDDPDLHLIADTGQVIRKARDTDGYAMFVIPSNVSEVRIVSRTARPSDAVGPFVDDRRDLGVCVGEIVLFDPDATRVIDTHRAEAGLKGWYAREEDAEGRWTRGDAILPLGERHPGGIGLLGLKILAAGPYLRSTGFAVKKTRAS
ncbi:MAG TPA: Hint domain-containing protein, partial [Acidiphilium sp.]